MVCFVVLHYLTFDETVANVDCILNNVKGEKKIIIVDNGSNNNSGIELKKYYENNEFVDIIISDDDLGFANGNNLGYEYAKEKYNPDFIVALNNDVEINQSDFIDKIYEIYKKEKYHILSPNIYSTYSKINQSPKRLKRYTVEELRSILKDYEKRNKSKVFIPVKCWLKSIGPLKKIMQRIKFKKKNIDYSKKYINVPVHGACVIFSKDYIKEMSYAFFDKTFMYFEMEILDVECSKRDFKVIYDPSIEVFHHHSVSSQHTMKRELTRERFVNKCVVDSISNYLEEVN